SGRLNSESSSIARKQGHGVGGKMAKTFCPHLNPLPLGEEWISRLDDSDKIFKSDSTARSISNRFANDWRAFRRMISIWSGAVLSHRSINAVVPGTSSFSTYPAPSDWTSRQM